MLIVSQNISNHNITFNSAVIYRINLAWINNLQELEVLLKKHDKQKIFLDLPVNRIKPQPRSFNVFHELHSLDYKAVLHKLRK